MNSRLLFPVACGAMCLMAVVVAAAPGPGLVPAESMTAPVREIYVPFDDLNVILENDKNRVFLTRGEYEELIVRSRSRPQLAAPLQAAMVAAEYRARLEEGRALITGRLTIEVMAAGLHALPLDLGGVGIRTATLDGRSAPLVRAEDLQLKKEAKAAARGRRDARPMLLVEGVGQHQLVVELTAPLATVAAQQTLQFRAPMMIATRLFVSAPGNVEVKTGAAVISRRFDEGAGRTEFELLPAQGGMAVVLSLNNRLLKDEHVMVASSVIIDEVTQGYERLHATISYRVLQGAAQRLRLSIPAGFETTTVETANLSRWEEKEAGQGRKIVAVALREPSTDKVVVRLVANRSPTAAKSWLDELAHWSFPIVEPLDVAGQNAVLGLAAEERLDAAKLAASGLVPIDSSGLESAIPASVLQAEPGAPTIRQVASYFAPSGDYSLAAALAPAAEEVNAVSHALLVVSDQGLKLAGGLSITPRAESLFAVHLSLPAGWELAKLTDQEGRTLHRERYAAAEGRMRTLVRLTTGIKPGDTAALQFEAEQTPAGWLAESTTRTVEFPRLVVEESTQHTGAIAVQAADDLVVRPDKISGLVPIADREKRLLGIATDSSALAYRFNAADYAASVVVERLSPSLTARVASFLTLQPDYLIAHYELDYDIRDARASELVFSLPAATPSEVTVRALDGLQLKDVRSEMVGQRRQWTAELAQRRMGRVRLAVDFARQVDYDEPLELPIAAAEAVEYQSGLVAVEGHPELEVSLQTGARRADVGELSAAEHALGRYVVGTFSYVGDAPVFSATAKLPTPHPLPTALIERVELVTKVAASGLAQSAARFALVTKATLLEIQLPEDAELWSVLLDGQPVKPQREGASLLVSLPNSAAAVPRNLQIVYESRVSPIGFRGTLQLEGARLFVRAAGREGAREVPQADLVWHLYLPSGYKIVRSGGTVELEEAEAPKLAIVEVGQWLIEAAGGIHPWALSHMVLSNRLSQAKTATTAHPEAVAIAAALSDAAASESVTAPPPPATPALEFGGREEGKSAQEPAAAAKKMKNQWALEGVSSLKINIDPAAATGVTLRSLGERPLLEGVIVDGQRLEAAAGGLGLLVALVGVGLTRRPVRQQMRFVACALVLSTVPLLLLESLEAGRPIFNAVFLAACWVLLWYVAAGIARIVYRRVAAIVPARLPLPRPAEAMTVLVFLAASLAAGHGFAHPWEPEDTTPVSVPADAIIIPYDPEKPDERDETGKVLVPYARYLELWSRAYPDRPLAVKTAPVDYAIAGTEYEATLNSTNSLSLAGRMSIDVFSENAVEVPLGFAGGMIEQMLVDGQTARLSVMEAASGAGGRVFLLHVQGKGRKKVEFRLRLSLTRQGGWRRVQARLPLGLAASLTVQVPEAGTEVRQASLADRATWETKEADETIRWALPASGAIDFQWRTKVASATVDESLTVQSAAVLDAREDALRVTWQMRLAFGRSQREAFTLLAPPGYVIEAVQGENVRGWTQTADDDAQRLEVSLLKPATGSERLTVVLSRRERVGEDSRETIRAPAVDVEGAALHQGEILVRQSPRLALRTIETSGLAPVDPSAALAEVQKAADAIDPAVLQPRPYQTFRFAQTPFRLVVAAVEPQASPSATIRAALRIAASETTLDAAVTLKPAAVPLYQVRLSLPAGLKITRLGPADVEWWLEEAGGRQELTILLPDGQTEEFQITLLGEIPAAAGEGSERSLALPRITVRDATEQEGEIAILPDPDTEVRVSDVRGAVSAPIIRPLAWMKPEQQPLAKSVVRFRGGDYSGTIVVRARTPLVSARSITNMKVTSRSIEETVLVNFQIREAGIRQVQLLIPEHLAKARLKARLIRQKTIEPATDGGELARGMLGLTLDLQDDVRGEYAVLLEHDRPLSGAVQTIVPPVILTGRTDRRLVAIENDGQDEVVVGPEDVHGLEPVHRQAQAWRELAGVLGEQVTVAYSVRDGAADPQLRFRTLSRPRTMQATARIGLATTLLVVDRAGAYRAMVQYRVSNETEPYLQIAMPAGATLWTATVAGQPVKPTEATPPQAGAVRIPLVKTAEGEGDYLVELKYGGQMRPASALRSVEFPLIQETNIHVEQSIVRLFVPESQQWFRFGGTMRMVADEQQLAAGFQSYLYRRIQDAAQALASGSDYTKVRASVNLQQSKELLDQSRSVARSEGGAQAKLEAASEALLEQAEQQVQLQLAAPQDGLADNRVRLNEFYLGQTVERSKDVVTELASNFDAQSASRGDKASLNKQWFEQNSLLSDNNPPANAPAPRAGMSASGTAGGLQSRLTRRGAYADDAAQVRPGLEQTLPGPQSGQGRLAIGGKPLADLQNQSRDEMELEHLRQRASEGQVEELRRYQRNLQERLEADNSRSGQPGEALGGYGTRGGEAANLGERMAGRQAGGYSAPASGREVQDRFRAIDLRAAEPFDREDYKQLSAGLASLDVRLSERGTLYRFTTPRGQIAISARAISRATLAKFIVVGLLLLAGATGCCLSQPAARRFFQAVKNSLAGAALVVIAGLASVVSGVLPLAGLLLVAAGLSLMIRVFVVRMQSQSAEPLSRHT